MTTRSADQAFIGGCATGDEQNDDPHPSHRATCPKTGFRETAQYTGHRNAWPPVRAGASAKKCAPADYEPFAIAPAPLLHRLQRRPKGAQPRPRGSVLRELQEPSTGRAARCLKAHTLDPERGKFVPRPADIVAGLQQFDGHPSADEAWAMSLAAADERATVAGPCPWPWPGTSPGMLTGTTAWQPLWPWRGLQGGGAAPPQRRAASQMDRAWGLTRQSTKHAIEQAPGQGPHHQRVSEP